MNDLIARLEAATEGSRKLDAEIAEAIHPDRSLAAKFERAAKRPVNEWGEAGWNLDSVPHYTTNLQDARALGGMLVYASDIGADGLPMVTLVFDTSTSPVVEHTGIGATLELAWCIAAMKARQQ